MRLSSSRILFGKLFRTRVVVFHDLVAPPQADPVVVKKPLGEISVRPTH
jgi:hypothetical protein